MIKDLFCRHKNKKLLKKYYSIGKHKNLFCMMFVKKFICKKCNKVFIQEENISNFSEENLNLLETFALQEGFIHGKLGEWFVK